MRASKPKPGNDGPGVSPTSQTGNAAPEASANPTLAADEFKKQVLRLRSGGWGTQTSVNPTLATKTTTSRGWGTQTDPTQKPGTTMRRIAGVYAFLAVFNVGAWM